MLTKGCVASVQEETVVAATASPVFVSREAG